MRPRLLFFGALVALGVLAAACGGGGGTSPALPHGGLNTQSSTTGATVHVVIPKSSGTSSSTRKPAFIASNTATITIGVYTVNGATPSPLPTPLSVTIATNADCTSGSSGTTCNITVTVPVATSVVLQLSTYDSSGDLLGQALIGPINTTLATIPTQSVSVGGVPAKILFSPTSLSAVDDGATHAVTFTVTAQDASGNTIVQPGNYPDPIALAITGDTNGALSLSATSIASPGPTNGATTVTLTYNSAISIVQATIGATSGSASASVLFARTITTGGGQIVGPQYTIEKYPLPEPSGPGNQPYGIATGPDGQSLWIVDQAQQNVDVIASPSTCTSSCSVANLAPGIFGFGYYDLQSIVTASDGNIYVSDPGNGSSDLGNFFQLDGCSASTASCGGMTSQSFGQSDLATPAPGPILAGSDGNLYVGSQADNGQSYGWGAPIMFSPTIGCCNFSFSDMIWLPDTNSSPSSVNGLTIDASGVTLWYTDGATGNIGYQALPCTGQCPTAELPSGQFSAGSARRRPIVARAGKKIVHPYKQTKVRDIPAGGNALSTALDGVVSGPDGYLYIADPGNHTIDQIDPTVWDGNNGSGTYTSCSGSGGTCTYTPITLPQSAAMPMNLTVGPDGNVWFTDTTGYIGFVSLSSCASASGCKAFEYSVGGAPWGIVAGPDGDIWFTLSTGDSNFNNIGKVVLP